MLVDFRHFSAMSADCQGSKTPHAKSARDARNAEKTSLGVPGVLSGLCVGSSAYFLGNGPTDYEQKLVTK